MVVAKYFFFRRFHKSLSENPWKCSPQYNSRSIVFLRFLSHLSMGKVGYHSKTMVHRNQAPEGL